MMQTTVPQSNPDTTAQNGSNSGAKGETPSSNTGLNSHRIDSGLSIRVDTLAVVFRQVPDESAARAIIDLLQQTFDEFIEFHPDLPTTNGKRWDGHSTSSLRGLKVWWDNPTEDKPGQLYCYLGGAVLGAATHRAAQDLFACLGAMYGADCKRFDVALDDYDKTIPLDQVEHDARAGHYAYVESHQFIESGKRGKDAVGKTIYLGSAKSNKLIRIYDKSTQTGGEVDAIRIEVQFRDSKAMAAYLGWIDFDAGAGVDVAAPSYLAQLVTGAVRFCDRAKGDKNIERCPMLPWWEALVDRVGQGIKVAAPRVVKTLERCMAWVDHQVAPTIALLKRAMGDGFANYIDAVTTLGDERLTPRHLAIIAIEGYA